MAILGSNGILNVDSIPTHTPLGNQSRLARLQDSATFFFYNGSSWETVSIEKDLEENQLAFGGANGIVTGSDDLIRLSDGILFRGSGADRFIRFAESPGVYNGAFIQYEGSTNKFHVGIHPTADALNANDIKVLTLLRSNGFLGINTENPSFELDMLGTFRNEGVRISPTFTDFTNRVALVNPSFGSARLGDSELQTPNIDIGTALSFKTANQVTQWAAFANAVGNTLTLRHVQNPTALLSIQNDAASTTRGVTNAESTLGLVTHYNNGESYVFDLFNQEYIANGSVLAQAQGVNMIAPAGDHRKFGIYRSDPGLTNIRTVMEISADGDGDQAQFFQPVKGIDAVNSDELITKGQLDAATKYNLSNSEEELDYTYFGETVYGILLQIPTPESGTTNYTFTHNLNIAKYLKLELVNDGIPMSPDLPITNSGREDLLKLVNDNAGFLTLTDDTIDTGGVNFPASGVFVYVEYIKAPPIPEGVGGDIIGTSAIGVD